MKKLLFQTLREPPVNRKDLRALTLVGPTRDNPIPYLLVVLHPQDVLHLDNQLNIDLGLSH